MWHTEGGCRAAKRLTAAIEEGLQASAALVGAAEGHVYWLRGGLYVLCTSKSPRNTNHTFSAVDGRLGPLIPAQLHRRSGNDLASLPGASRDPPLLPPSLKNRGIWALAKHSRALLDRDVLDLRAWLSCRLCVHALDGAVDHGLHREERFALDVLPALLAGRRKRGRAQDVGRSADWAELDAFALGGVAAEDVAELRGSGPRALIALPER